MNNHHRAWIWLSVALMTVSAAEFAWAQQAPDAEQAEDAEQPEDAPLVPVEPDSPAVAAVLSTKPTSPDEMTRAAKTLADLDRPDLAKAFLKKVLGAGLDERQLAALQARFGSAMFVSMAARGDLAPEGKQLAEAVLVAANRQKEDPARLTALIEQLRDPSAEVRYRAFVGLRQARGAATGPLLAVLADPNRSVEHTNVRAALARLGRDVMRPLVDALASDDLNVQIGAIGVLGELRAREAVVYLLAPYASPKSDPRVREAARAALLKLVDKTPDKQQAAALLASQAERYFQRLEPIRTDESGLVKTWTWDTDNRQLRATEYPADEASLVWAARLARDAYAVDPQSKDIRLLYLASMLERAVNDNGPDHPLSDAEGTPAAEAAQFGTAVMVQVLEYSTQNDHAKAATAAARILGQKGTADELLNRGSRPAPLVRAAKHKDRRLRFAAVEAILGLNPRKPFAGSSDVLDALAFFARASGQRRVLVAATTKSEALRVSGYLAGMGYEFDTVTSGRELISLAIASADYELALVDASLKKPLADFSIQRLRQDYRSADLPVGLFARAGQLDRAERIARRDPLVEAFPRPHTEESVHRQVQRVLASADGRTVALAHRTKQASQALEWLADLAGSDQKVFNVYRVEDAVMTALYTPELGSGAVAVLGNLGTAVAQTALVDLASRWTQPLVIRTAATEALWKNTAEHGILLTSRQILLQYDRYNQSRDLDSATQGVLASILNCMEAPMKAAGPGDATVDEGSGRQ